MQHFERDHCVKLLAEGVLAPFPVIYWVTRVCQGRACIRTIDEEGLKADVEIESPPGFLWVDDVFALDDDGTLIDLARLLGEHVAGSMVYNMNST